MDDLREAMIGFRRDELVPNPHVFDHLHGIGDECGEVVSTEFAKKWRRALRLNHATDSVAAFVNVDLCVGN